MSYPSSPYGSRWTYTWTPRNPVTKRKKRVVVLTKIRGRSADAVTEDGEKLVVTDTLDALTGFEVVTPLSPWWVRQLELQAPWQELRSHGRVSWLRDLSSGVKVRPWRVSGHELDAEDLIRAFVDIRDNYGVNPGPKSAMAAQLWERSLREPVTISEDAEPGRYVGRATFQGGRKGARGQYLSNAMYIDIAAAYPSAMLGRFPTRLWRDGHRPQEWCADGFARALVDVPALAWGPLAILEVTPHGIKRHWPTGKILKGLWSYAELLAARGAGCEVKILQSYRASNYVDLFGPWWRTFARPLRETHGIIGKMLANVLWSHFAPSTDPRTLTTYRGNDEGETERMPRSKGDDFLEPACFVASIIASRVRAKLYTQGLRQSDSVYCDTDSVILPRGSKVRPGWTVKRDDMTDVEVAGIGAFRYLCADCDEPQRRRRSGTRYAGPDGHAPWHYVVSGAQTEVEQRYLFEHWRGLPLVPGQVVDVREGA